MHVCMYVWMHESITKKQICNKQIDTHTTEDPILA